MNEFIYDSLDIIMETNQLNFNNDSKKLIFCTSYHYDNPIFKECTNIIKQIIEKQTSINVSIYSTFFTRTPVCVSVCVFL